MLLKISTLTLMVVAICASLLGCTPPFTPNYARQVEERRVVYRNYEVATPFSVSIGAPVIKVQDYTIQSVETGMVSPDRDVRIAGGHVDIELSKDMLYPVVGSTVLSDVGPESTVDLSYRIVGTSVPVTGTRGHWGVLIRKDGSIHDQVVALGATTSPVVAQVQLTISDPETRLEQRWTQSIDPASGYENFELIYAGRSAAGLNFTYREYDANVPGAISIFQNLTYDEDTAEIVFKGFKLAVEKSTPESIVVTVIEHPR